MHASGAGCCFEEGDSNVVSPLLKVRSLQQTEHRQGPGHPFSYKLGDFCFHTSKHTDLGKCEGKTKFDKKLLSHLMPFPLLGDNTDMHASRWPVTVTNSILDKSCQASTTKHFLRELAPPENDRVHWLGHTVFHQVQRRQDPFTYTIHLTWVCLCFKEWLPLEQIWCYIVDFNWSLRAFSDFSF